MSQPHVTDYSKALAELAKYEVRHHGSARHDKTPGVFLKGTAIRCATFMPAAMAFQRALDIFLSQQEFRAGYRKRYRQKQEPEPTNDQASADSA